MKKYVKYLVIVLFAVIILTGCEPKRKDVTFKGEEGTITFAIKEDSECKISTKDEDLRTTREQGSLVCKDFKIGIEFDEDYGYFFNSDFEKLKSEKKDNEYYKEVTYSDKKAVQYFYGGYNEYEILIPVENNKKYLLRLNVYGAKDTEEASKKAIKNEEVQDILNNITNIKAVK